MLTRKKLKQGEGQLEALNKEIQRRLHKQEMSSPRKLGPFTYEDDFFESLKLMKAMVEELYHERGLRRNPKVEEGESSVRAPEGGVGGGGPSEPSSPSSSSSTSEASVHPSKDKKPKKTHHSFDIVTSRSGALRKLII
jgi:hypothetical protein